MTPEGPSKEHSVLMAKLLDQVVGGEFVELISRDLPANSRMKVFGPAIDLYWPRPFLNEGFKTSIEGVTVIGDAAGRSRGIYQALVAGTAWALHQECGSSSTYPLESVAPDKKRRI